MGRFRRERIAMLLAVHTKHTDVRYGLVGVDLEALSKSVLLILGSLYNVDTRVSV
jgi:hypothetical protein